MDFLNWQFLLGLALMNALSTFLKILFYCWPSQCSVAVNPEFIVWYEKELVSGWFSHFLDSSSTVTCSYDHPYSSYPCHLRFHRLVSSVITFSKLQAHGIHSYSLYGTCLTPLSSCSLALFQLSSLAEWRSRLVLFLECAD